jgi:hypothetical protein
MGVGLGDLKLVIPALFLGRLYKHSSFSFLRHSVRKHLNRTPRSTKVLKYHVVRILKLQIYASCKTRECGQISWTNEGHNSVPSPRHQRSASRCSVFGSIRTNSEECHSHTPNEDQLARKSSTDGKLQV